ncbi:MAG: IS1096 element passenger TnpR family protein [Bacteroidales bacterium]
MIFRFKFTFLENSEFKRVYDISGDQTLYDFHHFIQSDLDYDEAQPVRFFASNARWEKQQMFTLFGENGSDLMDETTIGALVRAKEHYLIYTFDVINERSFMLELEEILEPQVRARYPRVELEKEMPPVQIGKNTGVFSSVFDQAMPDFDANMYIGRGNNSDE